jgi:hypothetical protein
MGAIQIPAKIYSLLILLLFMWSIPASSQETHVGNEVETGAVEASAQAVESPLLEPEVESGPWFDVSGEYRLRTLHVNPVELSGTQARDITWTEQRARLKSSFGFSSFVKLTLQLDLLDGVLVGDNGDFGGDPSTNTGVSLTVREPNNTSMEIGLPDGADPLNPDSYVPVFSEVSPVVVRQLYADIVLPFGLLRLGRQPVVEGAYLAAHDGERRNRWGVSRYPDTADRVLFATKLDELVRILRHPGEHVLDARQDRGLFIGLAYDWLTQGDIPVNGDETRRYSVALIWRHPEVGHEQRDIHNLEASITAVHLRNSAFDTAVWSLPCRFQGQFGPLGLLLQYSIIAGKSREISEGFAVLTHDEPVRQRLLAHGAQFILDWQFDRAMFTLEFDLATGDDDPRPSTDLTVFSFSRDLNVGLLLFEQILAFETARTAAVGVENLISLDSPSFPLTEVSSEGRFSNAYALFPQLTVDLVRRPENLLQARFGALFAWPHSGVVDPVMTALNEDGIEIDDDAVNYHGGDPGHYYGTELDGQLSWDFREHFIWTVEAAVLFPGDALQDEHGHAVNAYSVENRFEVLF